MTGVVPGVRVTGDVLGVEVGSIIGVDIVGVGTVVIGVVISFSVVDIEKFNSSCLAPISDCVLCSVAAIHVVAAIGRERGKKQVAVNYLVIVIISKEKEENHTHTEKQSNSMAMSN